MVRYKQIVHTWMFGNTPFEQIVHLLACAGADGLDLSFALDGPYSWKNLLASAPKYTRLIRDAGMTVPAATPLYFKPEIELCSEDASVRSRGTEFTKGCAEAAAAYGSHNLLVVPSWVSVHHRLTAPHAEHMKYAAESISKVALYAKTLDVDLLIEPVNRYRVALVHTIREALDLINLVDMDNVHIAADIFHMQMEERAGIVNGLYQANTQLKCLHIGDNTRCCPGSGAMDWYAILAALKAINFSGPLSYEPAELYFSETRVEQEPEYVARFVSGLKDGFIYLNNIMDRL